MKLRLAILSAFCVAGWAQGTSTTLLGKWRSVETSKGGIGAVVDFHSDGTFDYSPGAVLGGHYRVEAARLIMTPDNGEPENAQTIQSLTAATLRLSVADNASLDFKRVGAPEDKDNLLLGTWVTVRTMPGMPVRGYYYFRRDGRETFVIPFRTDRCNYAFSGDRIRLTNRQGTKEGPMRWDGEILTLPWGRGEATFKRF